MPELRPEQRAAGGRAFNPPTCGHPRPGPGEGRCCENGPLPIPDQSRYGPPGTTDSPRFRADGVTPWPRDSKDPEP